VAALIRRACTSARLSRVKLAERAGTSQPAFARYETGAALPTLPTLERLLLACGRGLQIRTSKRMGARLRQPRCAAGSARGHANCVAAAGDCLTPRERAASARCACRDRSPAARTSPPATSTSSSTSSRALRSSTSPLRREAEGVPEQPVDVATPDMPKARIRADVSGKGAATVSRDKRERLQDVKDPVVAIREQLTRPVEHPCPARAGRHAVVAGWRCPGGRSHSSVPVQRYTRSVGSSSPPTLCHAEPHPLPSPCYGPRREPGRRLHRPVDCPTDLRGGSSPGLGL
jgi:hypothetical protein